MIRNVDLIKAHLNPTLRVSTILMTMYDSRTRLAHQVVDDVRAHFGDTVLKTTIPRSVRVSEAPSYGQTVLTYDPGSSGALSYLEAAREIAIAGRAPGACSVRAVPQAPGGRHRRRPRLRRARSGEGPPASARAVNRELSVPRETVRAVPVDSSRRAAGSAPSKGHP